jgi:hypothetical protein
VERVRFSGLSVGKIQAIIDNLAAVREAF